MNNYNTNLQNTKSLIKLAENTTKAVDYILSLNGAKFVELNSKGLPVKSYKKADPINKDKVLTGLNKTGHIGLVPKSIGFWVFVKSNKLCRFKDPNAISYRDEQGWLQYWYVGTIYKSLNPYRCNIDLKDPHNYCGRIIQQNEYIILSAKDLGALTTKLINTGIFKLDGSLYSVDDKPELKDHYQKLPAEHIKSRQRLYKDLSPKEMIAVVRNLYGYNLYYVVKALILEMAIREHAKIKSGELDRKYLELILAKFMEVTRKSITLNKAEQNKILDNAFNFAKNNYVIKRDHPKRHFDWINLYKQGMTMTDIGKQYNKDRSTVSKALKKYGIL